MIRWNVDDVILSITSNSTLELYGNGPSFNSINLLDLHWLRAEKYLDYTFSNFQRTLGIEKTHPLQRQQKASMEKIVSG